MLPLLGIWAATWQNQQSGMCAQLRLRSAWASAQSDQSSLPVWRNIGFLATHWAESEDSDQTGRKLVLLVLSWGGSMFVSVLVFVLISLSYEPCHEIMVLFVLRKLMFQTCMGSRPMGLDIWFLVGPFAYFHNSCARTAKALARLRGCAGSPEPSPVAYVISTIISWAGSYLASSSLFIFIRSRLSSLVTKINDLRGNPGLSLPSLSAKQFSCSVSHRLVGVDDHGVQISISFYQRGKRCKYFTYCCLESTHCWWTFILNFVLQIRLYLRF